MDSCQYARKVFNADNLISQVIDGMGLENKQAKNSNKWVSQATGIVKCVVNVEEGEDLK